LLDFIFQSLKWFFTRGIKLQFNPKLEELAKEGEEKSDLNILPPEDMLKRWFNQHLKNAGHPNQVEDYSKSLEDGEKYAHLLNQLDPNIKKEDILALQGADRIKKCIEEAQKLGVAPYYDAEEMSKGNHRVNYLFTAALYNAHLEKQPKAEQKPLEPEVDENELDEDSREERCTTTFASLTIGTYPRPYL
jgi:hypothetical protein